MIRIKHLLIITLVFFSFPLKSEECEKSFIFVMFANGMLTSQPRAEIAAHELSLFIQKWLPQEYLDRLYDGGRQVFLSYNESEKPRQQIREVVRQKYLEATPPDAGDGVHFVETLLSLVEGRFDFTTSNIFRNYNQSASLIEKLYADESVSLSSQFDESRYKADLGNRYDVDLATHISTYRRVLNYEQIDGKVIVVAHSQGNFYANQAHDALQSEDFKVISVATPSHRTVGDYVTLGDDRVISNLILGSIAKNSNVVNDFTSGKKDITGHDFVDSYLHGNRSRNLIVEYLKLAIEDLAGECLERSFRITEIEFPDTITIAPSEAELENELNVAWEGAPTQSLNIEYANINCNYGIGWKCPTENQPITRFYGETSSSFSKEWGCVATPNGFSEDAPASFEYSVKLTASNGQETDPVKFNYTCVNPSSTGNQVGVNELGAPTAHCYSDTGCYCTKPGGEVYFTSDNAITCCITASDAYIGADYLTSCSQLLRGGEGFVLQVGTFGYEENAISLKIRLVEKGYSAYVEVVDREQGDIYRVKIGIFETRNDADVIRLKLLDEERIESVIVPND